MACAKAVILTRTRGWWGECFLRDGDNRLVVPPGDVPALRRAIERFWSAPEFCTEIGARARETAICHFSEARFAESLGELVSSHLERS
jgi:glycosyltransferase involved in cell wall biosynthesis